MCRSNFYLYVFDKLMNIDDFTMLQFYTLKYISASGKFALTTRPISSIYLNNEICRLYWI